MPFKFCESHAADYMTQGYTIFRAIIPSSLIKDLRQVAEKGRQLARTERGPQAQRLQPVENFDLDQRPFKDYAELPELRDALQKVIAPNVWHGDLDMLGILVEPADAPWCTSWHRDITATSPGVDPEEFEYVRSKRTYFNQVNCALYDDTSTWYVPGSHLREDTLSEREHIEKCPTLEWQGTPEPGVSDEEQEVRCLEYCRAMPRAICLHLGPGDFGLYRPLGWHLGNYAPNRIRATLHDAVWTPEVKAWYGRWTERRQEIAAADN
ncbi:MAG TPA: phytanoyl-CoA dioxygenase family protein [Abditibacteriaceae bacterium]|nr:phytanoyl-CoA dioxygenase family protein [Abditibacteriaceae bacterium]